MNKGIFRLGLKSIKHYRKQVVYQFLIIMLLCAVITGSLMTGRSVRTSLKKTALEKIGNTRVFISSGTRYFERELAEKLENNAGFICTGLLELIGSSQGLASQVTANNTSIFAVGNDFFSFHGNDSLKIERGEIFINEKLATILGVIPGDEVSIRTGRITDIPADAPFAPEEAENNSIVLKVGSIIGAQQNGNFSLTISQIPSANIFLNLSDLDQYFGRKFKLNRLLIADQPGVDEIELALKENLEPADAGLHIRKIKATGEYELISDRVFIDEVLVNEIKGKIPGASPLITYLANSIGKEENKNPYSFVSALPEELYQQTPSGEGVVINQWLADDIGAVEGDSIELSWYAPDSLNHLVEESGSFRVEKVIRMQGLWADSMLMPDFPGIAASESCSEWDAGIPINTSLIRDKDEDYWNRYKGTPKAFLAYATGKELWGSNYGPATAIRFPAEVTAEDITMQLSGSLDPDLLGFTVNDIYNESLRAAENSVDFSTLFLSLGFFLILAALVLLSFAVSYYFELKKKEVTTLYSLGFKNNVIRNLLLYESLSVSLLACVTGSLAGYLVNVILIAALNSVWTGAVQTNALISAFDPASLLMGLFLTFIMTALFIYFKIRSYLKQLHSKGTKQYKAPDTRKNLFLLLAVLSVNITSIIFATITPEAIATGFIAGSLLLVTLLIAFRQYLLRKREKSLSGLYYSYYPSHAVTPALFIAAGIFAVFITALNRKNFDTAGSNSASGSGGYLFWMETSLPVMEDIETQRGRVSIGLDDELLSGMNFVQMKRTAGNDASCLNLNHITAPPLLGVNPQIFIKDEAFSFTKTIKGKNPGNPWDLLEHDAGGSAVYGIADQTVLDWGLKIGVGDTLILRAENGQPLKIIIAAGLQSSVFQGFVLISKQNLNRHFPSVSGNSVFLSTGDPSEMENYRELLVERLSGYGVVVEKTSDRLSAFYEITNTYLSVFGVFGALGMITGIAGLGFVLLRNYNSRKREFALMLATGFTPSRLRKMIFSEQVLILIVGIISGVIPAVVATMPSLRSNHEIPWLYLTLIVMAIFITGVVAMIFSSRGIRGNYLISAIRRD